MFLCVVQCRKPVFISVVFHFTIVSWAVCHIKQRRDCRMRVCLQNGADHNLSQLKWDTSLLQGYQMKTEEALLNII